MDETLSPLREVPDSQEDLHRTLVEAMDALILQLDPQGRVT